MLGSLRSKASWSWAAWGKHPVTKDYFRVGPSTPLLKAFSDWVKNGYRMLGLTHTHAPQFCSWRFWAKGLKKGNLVCGVGRDSSDSFGRPYPLMIMGSGFLDKWEEHWSLLPFALERIWRQIEYVSTRRFDDLNQIEDEISSIKPPDSNWSEMTRQRKRQAEFPSDHDKNSGPSHFRSMEEKISSLTGRSEFFVLLDNGPATEQLKQAEMWHFLLKKNLGEIPNAVFMGGSPQESSLVVFKRPLAPKDFVRLWTLSPMGAMEDGSFVTRKGTH